MRQSPFLHEDLLKARTVYVPATAHHRAYTRIDPRGDSTGTGLPDSKKVMPIQAVSEVGGVPSDFQKQVDERLVPEINTQEDIDRIIAEGTKKYKSRNEYLSSQEYRDIYPRMKVVYDRVKAKQMSEMRAIASKAMDETGTKYGDKVIYSVASPWGVSESVQGVVVNRDGVPYVDTGRAQGAGRPRFRRWHKGYIKVKNT